MGGPRDIGFNRDSESGLAHCYTKHSVHEREVIEVLRRPGQRFQRGEGTLAAEGQTNAGRYLRVIYRQYDRPDYIFVITAYDMSASAKLAYRRRNRRK